MAALASTAQQLYNLHHNTWQSVSLFRSYISIDAVNQPTYISLLHTFLSFPSLGFLYTARATSDELHVLRQFIHIALFFFFFFFNGGILPVTLRRYCQRIPGLELLDVEAWASVCIPMESVDRPVGIA